MLTKFERYIVPKARMGNIPTPINIKADMLYNNYLDKSNGVIQRLNVQPNEILTTKNKERIGFNTRAGRDYLMMGDWSIIATSSAHNRKARVYQSEINHMQSTPYSRKGGYVVQMENTGWTRSNAMLWARSCNDPYHRFGDKNEIVFTNIETAYYYARSLGAEIDVIYPHERYHEQKAYADNFLFQKETLSDIEDMDEICIENLEKKLL
jgi:hypothetical protein